MKWLRQQGSFSLASFYGVTARENEPFGLSELGPFLLAGHPMVCMLKFCLYPEHKFFQDGGLYTKKFVS